MNNSSIDAHSVKTAATPKPLMPCEDRVSVVRPPYKAPFGLVPLDETYMVILRHGKPAVFCQLSEAILAPEQVTQIPLGDVVEAVDEDIFDRAILNVLCRMALDLSDDEADFVRNPYDHAKSAEHLEFMISLLSKWNPSTYISHENKSSTDPKLISMEIETGTHGQVVGTVELNCGLVMVFEPGRRAWFGKHRLIPVHEEYAEECADYGEIDEILHGVLSRMPDVDIELPPPPYSSIGNFLDAARAWDPEAYQNE